LIYTGVAAHTRSLTHFMYTPTLSSSTPHTLATNSPPRALPPRSPDRPPTIPARTLQMDLAFTTTGSQSHRNHTHTRHTHARAHAHTERMIYAGPARGMTHAIAPTTLTGTMLGQAPSGARSQHMPVAQFTFWGAGGRGRASGRPRRRLRTQGSCRCASWPPGCSRDAAAQGTRQGAHAPRTPSRRTVASPPRRSGAR